MLSRFYVNLIYAVFCKKNHVDNSGFPHNFILKNVDKNVDMLIKCRVCALFDELKKPTLSTNLKKYFCILSYK